LTTRNNAPLTTLFGFSLASADDILPADATEWIGLDGIKSWQDGARKQGEERLKITLEEY
jgi:predicted secreted protein